MSHNLIIQKWFDEDLNAPVAAGDDIVALGTLSITGAADLDATGSLIAAGTLSITGVADLDASGTLVAAGSVVITGAADLDATGSLTAAGALAITGAADLDALGNLLAAGSVVITGVADLTSGANNNIDATGTLSITGVADLDASGTLVAAGSVVITGDADLDATGALLAAGSVVISGVADLTEANDNDITAVGSLSITGDADLDATASLLAAGSLSIIGLADLTDANAAVASNRGRGGDAPRRDHRNRDKGFNEERARKKREADEALTEEIRALYRKIALGEEPELAARVEAIVEEITSIPAAIVPNQPRKKRSVELRAAKIQLDKIEAAAEIAIRMAEQELDAKRKFRAEYMRRIEIILQAAA